jgi:hypothetical protein
VLIEIKSGLKGGEKIVISPPIDLADGSKVKIAQPDARKKQKSEGEKSALE